MAFIKTPTGKVVTVAIAGVPLLVIISYLVFFRRKSNGGSGKIVDDKDNKKVENAKGYLLGELFNNDQGRYDSFVNKLLGEFFNDEPVRDMFGNCDRDLDEFLKVVFAGSSFKVGGSLWKIKIVDCEVSRSVYFGGGWRLLEFAGLFVDTAKFYEKVFEYLCKEGLTVGSEVSGQFNWEVKIASILFGFWFLAEYDLKPSSSKVGEILEDKKCHDTLKDAFTAIRNYVGDCLKAAGRDYNGQKES